MRLGEILEKHGFSKNTIVKKIQIENKIRTYIVKGDDDKFYLLSDTESKEIDFVERVRPIPEPIPESKPKTKTKSKKKNKKKKKK